MTAYTTAELQALIGSQITANGNGGITGPLLSSLLSDLVESVAVHGEIEIDDIEGLTAALAGIPTDMITIADIEDLTEQLAALVTADTTNANAISALTTTVSGHTTSLATAATNITALQNADTALDTRIDALETAGGGGEVSVLALSGSTKASAVATGFKLHDPGTYSTNALAKAAGLADGVLYIDQNGFVKFTLPTGGVGGTPPPAGSVLISTWDPVNDENYYSPYFDVGDPKYGSSKTFWYREKKWVSDLSFQPWCLSSVDDNVLRFEVRAGDLFDVPGFYTDSAGVNRNKITEVGADWHNPTDDLLWTGEIMIEGPLITSNFFALVECHTYGGAAIYAQKFELIIRNEHFCVTTNFNPSSGVAQYYTAWTDPQAIVRGKWYTVSIFLRSVWNGSGRVVVDIDGTRVLNETRRIGYENETSCSFEFGIYRGTSSPETIVVSYRNVEIDSGAFNTLTIPTAPGGTPPATTYGPDLFGGSGSFDTAIAPWTTTDSAVATVVSGVARVATAGGVFTGPPSIRYQVEGLEVGATYRMQVGSYKRETGAAGSAQVLGYNSSFGTTYVEEVNTTTTAAAVDIEFVADDAIGIFFLARADATTNGDSALFNDVTLRKKIP